MKQEAIAKAAERTRAWMKTPTGHDQMEEWRGGGHDEKRCLGLAVIYATRIRRNEGINAVVAVLEN